MSDQAQMNGWQRLDSTVDCMKKGDVKCVQENLNNVQDQKLFMDLLGLKSQGATLPGLEIIDSNKDGHTDSVKVTGGKNKMTVSLSGEKLTVTDDSPTLMKSLSNAMDSAANKLHEAGKVIGAAIDSSAPAENIKRSFTSDSDQNRQWNAQIKNNGG